MGRFNMPLYQLRESTGLSQEAFGRKMAGYNAHTVMRIENGISGGKLDFWTAVQDYFDIPNERMWELMNGIGIDIMKEVRDHG